ncbi:hypothetical protein [Nostoc sp.]|uniref:hypothetical protein n=1 Tax=Nostoc sp. TaxID=1180 RepID=UPI002FF4DC1B
MEPLTTSNNRLTNATQNIEHTSQQLKTQDDNSTSIVVNIPSSGLSSSNTNRIEPSFSKPLWVDVVFNSLLTLYSTALATQVIAAIPATTPVISQLPAIAGTLVLAVITVAIVLVKRGGILTLPINVLVVPLSVAMGLLVGV